MKLLFTILPLTVFLTTQTACAESAVKPDENSCAACVEARSTADGIEAGIKKENLKPDPLNESTREAQLKYVKKTSEAVGTLLKDAETVDKTVMDALFDVWSTTVEFDTSHSIGILNYSLMKDHLDQIYTRLGQKIAKASDKEKAQLLAIRTSLAMAEDEAAGAPQDDTE